MKRFLQLVVILCFGLAVSRWMERQIEPSDGEPQPPARTASPPPVPELLPARPATPEHPLNSWGRLLVVGGTAIEDRASLEDIVINYLQSAPHSIRPPLGTNDEITRALMDRDTLGDSAIPASHPAIVSGQLVDRWGSPWLFHQLAADLIEVRSAGPDRKPFTADDIVK